MRLVCANVNGLRAAVRRGGVDWMAAAEPDVVCLQEVRADDDTARAILADAFPGWHVLHRPSQVRAGHSGVALLSRWPIVEGPDLGCGHEEGRWVSGVLQTPSGEAVEVACTYVHTGQADSPAQEDKERFLGDIGQWLERREKAILCGDLNVAHTQMDIKNWKGNIGKAGFLESERAHLTGWFEALGWVDLGREFGGTGPGPYTWWSWRGKAFDNDAGWRIDYVLASPDLAPRAKAVSVGRAAAYSERWSDHAPVVVDFAV